MQTKSILNELQQNSLDIMMCRGQAYDNASIMAGVRTGVQCRIKDINSKALFIPCGKHSFNLAGVHAVGSSEVSETIFAVALQQYFIDVVGALNKLCDQNENIDTRAQARGILDAIQRFSFVSFLQFWLEVLRESYDTQQYLQRKGLSLEECTHKMKAFIVFLNNERNTLVKQCICRGFLLVWEPVVGTQC